MFVKLLLVRHVGVAFWLECAVLALPKAQLYSFIDA